MFLTCSSTHDATRSCQLGTGNTSLGQPALIELIERDRAATEASVMFVCVPGRRTRGLETAQPGTRPEITSLGTPPAEAPPAGTSPPIPLHCRATSNGTTPAGIATPLPNAPQYGAALLGTRQQRTCPSGTSPLATPPTGTSHLGPFAARTGPVDGSAT